MDKIAPQLSNISEFMLMRTQVSDSSASACALGLVPILFSKMISSKNTSHHFRKIFDAHLSKMSTNFSRKIIFDDENHLLD